jgi:hypothetical protein
MRTSDDRLTVMRGFIIAESHMEFSSATEKPELLRRVATSGRPAQLDEQQSGYLVALLSSESIRSAASS